MSASVKVRMVESGAVMGRLARLRVAMSGIESKRQPCRDWGRGEREA